MKKNQEISNFNSEKSKHKKGLLSNEDSQLGAGGHTMNITY